MCVCVGIKSKEWIENCPVGMAHSSKYISTVRKHSHDTINIVMCKFYISSPQPNGTKALHEIMLTSH